MKRRITDCSKPRRYVRKHKLPPEFSGYIHGFKMFIGWVLIMLFDCISSTRIEYLWPLSISICQTVNYLKNEAVLNSGIYVILYAIMDCIIFLLFPLKWIYAIAGVYIWFCYFLNTEKRVLHTLDVILIMSAIYSEFTRNISYEIIIFKLLACHSLSFGLISAFYAFRRCSTFKIDKIFSADNFYNTLCLLFNIKNQGKSCRIHQKQDTCTNDFNYTIQQNTLESKEMEMNSFLLSYENSICRCKKKCNICNSDSNISIDGGLVNNDVIDPMQRIHEIDHKIVINGYSLNTMTTLSEKDSGKSIKNASFSLKNNSAYSKIHYNNFSSSGGNSKTNIAEFEEDYANSIISNNSNNNNNNNNNSDNSSGNQTSAGQHKLLSNSKEGKIKLNQRDSNENSSPNNAHKENYYKRLETQLKKLKLDLQISQHSEVSLKDQINTLSKENSLNRQNLLKVQKENDEAQSRLRISVSARKMDKDTLTTLRKELVDERKQKHLLEVEKSELLNELEKKEALLAEYLTRLECGEKCKMKRKHLEDKNKILKAELNVAEAKYSSLRDELSQELYRYKESYMDVEQLNCTISALRESNNELENKLSSETRIKLDLFSALGEVKRELEIRNDTLRNKEEEIDSLRIKVITMQNCCSCIVSPFHSKFNLAAYDLNDNLLSSYLDGNNKSYSVEKAKSQL